MKKALFGLVAVLAAVLWLTAPVAADATAAWKRAHDLLGQAEREKSASRKRTLRSRAISDLRRAVKLYPGDAALRRELCIGLRNAGLKDEGECDKARALERAAGR